MNDYVMLFLDAANTIHPAQEPPDPAPKPPPGMDNYASQLIAAAKWFVLIAGILGLLASAVMIMWGRRRNNEMAVQGFMGVGMGLVGLAIASMAAALVGWFSM